MPPVPSELGSGTVHDRPRGLAEMGPQIALGVAVGDEADVVGVGFVRDSEAQGMGLRPHLRFRRVGEWEQGAAQLVLVQHAEHVGLVLVRVGGAVQFKFRPVVHDPGVMSRRDGVETERETAFQYGCEFDLLVAPEARIRGATRTVLGYEIVDHIPLELLREIPHIEGNIQQVGGTPGIVGILQGATATRSFTIRLRVTVQRQVYPGHVVSGGDEARRSDGGVNPARHGCQYLHLPSLLRIHGRRILPGHPGPFHGHRQHLTKPIDIPLATRVTEGETNRGHGLILGGSHRQHDLAGPVDPGAARGTRRGMDVLSVEKEQ